MYREQLEAQGYMVVAISAATQEGIPALLEMIWVELERAGGPSLIGREEPEQVVIEMPQAAEYELRVEKLEEGVFAVTGSNVERLMARADLIHDEGIQRTQRALEKMGILTRLLELGAEEGDTVLIGDAELEYRPDYI